MREAVVAYIRSTADWRDRKAEEYPDDERNARSATALREMADLVEQLPEDAAEFVALSEVILCVLTDDILMPGEEASRFLSRYGFSGTRLPLPYFGEFVQIAVTEGREWYAENAEYVTA
jgi:hypothetical protein